MYQEDEALPRTGLLIDLFIVQSRPQIFDIPFALTTKGLSEEQKKGCLPVESLAELEIGGFLVLETQ